MNKQIEELLERVSGYGTVALIHPDDIDKFVELLIKEITGGILPECDHFFAGESRTDRKYTQQELSDLIKDHFGVK